jgi:hypothetical protein
MVLLVLLGTACSEPAPPAPALRFVETTREAGLARTSPTYAVAAADFDADGAVDLFVSNHAEGALLFRNQGDGTFREAGDVLAVEPGDIHGASWLDWNGDGWLDLFVATGANWGAGTGPKRLYLSRDGKHLAPVSPPEPILDERGRGRSGCPLDLDGDGRLDVLVMNQRPGPPHRLALQHAAEVEDVVRRLGVARMEGTGAAIVHLSHGGPPAVITTKLRVYRQDAAGQFKDATEALGLPQLDFVQAIAPGDYDGDGDLDLYVVRGWMEPGGAVVDGKLWFDMPFRNRGSFATRFRARGDLVLELEDAGPRRPPAPHPELLRLGAERHAVDALPWRGRADDARLAGEPALSPRTDAGVFFWRGDDGAFTLSTVGLPREGVVRGHVSATEGLELVDSLTTNKRPKDLRSRLFENRDGSFVDVTDRAGVGADGYGRDAVFADLDNDGDLDLYVVTGGIRGRNPPDVLYRNDGDGTFTDVSAESGAAGPGDGTGDAVVAFDYDRDGRLDLFTANGHGALPHGRGPYWLGQNRSEAGGFVELTLTGRRSNRMALGARVRARLGKRTLLIERYACTGPLATSVLPVHIGLGPADAADLEILWPSGATSRVTGRAGERLEAVEPAGPGT